MAVKIRIDGETGDFERKLSELATIGEKAMKGVKVAAVAAGTALVALGTYAFNVGKDFEAGMSGVQAILQTTDEEIEQLSALAKEMGATTVYSATQAAEAMQFIAQAGYDAAGAAELLPDVLNLAATDAMDLGVAAQYVTNGLAIFGDAAGGAAHYADILATTASAADGGVSDMAEAFMVAGGQAMLAGLSMDELATAVGVLANNGIKGSEGGTHLRNALKNLYTPTDDAAKAMGELGIQTRNADGTLVGMQDVLQQFQAELSDLDEAARLDYMGRIFDTRTLAAANALINNSTTGWDELALAMEGAEGAAARMAEIKLDNLEGDITLLKSAMEGFGIQIYETFSDSARGAVQGLTQTVEMLMKAFDRPEVKAAIEAIGKALKDLITTIGSMLAVILPPLIQALGFVAKNADVLIPLIVGLAAAFKLMSIVNTVTQAMNAYKAANAATQALMAVSVKTTTSEVVAQNMLTAALAKNTTAETIRRVAKTAGMTIDATGNLITAAGTKATAAETAAVLINSGALSAKAVIVGVLNGSISLATALQWLWNSAILANPIGLIIAGAVALTAALAGLANWLSRDTEEMAALKEESAALVEETRKLREEYESAQVAFEGEAAAMNTNADAAINLTDKLSSLMATANRTAAEEEQLASIVNDLNGLVPGLALEYNKYNKQLNMTEDAILAVVEAERERSLAQLKLDRAVELEKERLVMQERREELLEKEAALKEQIDNMGPLTAGWKMAEAQEAIIATREELAELDALIPQTEANAASYREEAAELVAAQQAEADAFTESGENLQYLADKYGTTVEAIRAATDGSAESINNWAAAQDAALSAAAERVEETLGNIVDAYYDSNSKIDLSNATSLQNRIENISENQRISGEYANNLALIGAQVGDQLDAGLLAELQRGDEEAMALAQQLVNSLDAGDDKWQELNDLYANDVDGVLTTVAEAMTFKDANPADDLVDEIITSIETGSLELNIASEQMITEAVETAKTAVTTSSSALQLLGANLVFGIANGVTNHTSFLEAAMTTLITSAIQAAKDAANINSPSRLARDEVGRWIPAGVAEGVTDGTGEVVDAVHDQAAAILDAYGDLSAGFDVDALAEGMRGMFEGVPDEFFSIGETSGEQFVAGFTAAAFGYFALFENMMAGNVMMSGAVGGTTPQGGGDVIINFNEEVESPDATAQFIKNVFNYGMAGERN